MGLDRRIAAVAVALALAAGGLCGANAAPAGPVVAAPAAPSPLVRAESDPSGFTLHRHYRNRTLGGGFYNRPAFRGVYRPVPKVVIPYVHGYRGYVRKRPGYRRHVNGWWYPRAAFRVQVIVPQPRYRSVVRGALPGEHYIWCDRRYRSYRAWDDTFKPYRGPRRICNSPFDGR